MAGRFIQMSSKMMAGFTRKYSMSLVLAAMLAIAPVAPAPAAPAAVATCSWTRPGQNPFMGDVVAAVDRYSDIPAPVRKRLQSRMAARSYDEVVSIRRDAIVGQARYGSAITGMQFGAGQVCGTVSRAQWAPGAQERGLVYCESGHCILVPTVCRNVSRITRQDVAAADATAPSSVAGMEGSVGGGGGGGGGGLGVPGPGQGMAAPGAGPGSATSVADGPPQASFSQAVASPGTTGSYAAGGPDSLGGGGGAAGGAEPALPGSWAAAAGRASLGGVALGADGLALPLRQLSALPPENRGPLTDRGSPANPSSGPAIGPLLGPVGGGVNGGGPAVSPVPEPQSVLLMLAGLAGLGWRLRRASHQRTQR